MAHVYKKGDKAYIVDNVRFLHEVIVLRASRDFYIIKYTDSNAASRVRRNRLFESEDKAIATMPADARSKRNSHWDYYQNH